MAKNFPTITPTMISNAVDTGIDAMYRELQNIMHTDDNWDGDGGVARMHYSSGECDDLKEELVKFMTRYVELERIYAPKIKDEDESPYSDPNYLLEAREVEAQAALESYSFAPMGGLEWDGMFWRKAGEPDELVTNLIVGFADGVTHTMTVEFEPGTPNVIHIDVQPIEEIQVEAEGHGAFCD
jgi:hypothetical protein